MFRNIPVYKRKVISLLKKRVHQMVKYKGGCCLKVKILLRVVVNHCCPISISPLLIFT